MNFSQAFRALFAPSSPKTIPKSEVTLPADVEREAGYSLLRTKGVSGTQVSGGEIIGYEPNPLFYRWSTWSSAANEMFVTDPKQSGAIGLMFNTLKSAKWRVDPASDSAYDRMISEKVAEQLGLNGHSPRLKGSFEKEISKFLPFVTVGARYVEDSWYIGPDGSVWLAGWEDREPTAHARWEFDIEGNFEGVTQYIWNSIKPDAKPIPASDLLLFTHNRTGQNLRGVGLQRPAYSWWKLKEFMREVIGVGGERWAVPTPRVTVDRAKGKESGYSDPEIDVLVAAAQKVAGEYAAQMRTYVQDTPFVTLGVFGEGQVMDFKGPLDVIAYCDQAILTALVMQFMQIGFTQIGARSVTEVHENSFRMFAVNVLDNIRDTLMAPDGPGQGSIHRMLKHNFGDVPASSLPKLTHSGIELDPLILALPELVGLIEADLLDKTPALKERIHGHLKVAPATLEDEVVVTKEVTSDE